MSRGICFFRFVKANKNPTGKPHRVDIRIEEDLNATEGHAWNGETVLAEAAKMSTECGAGVFVFPKQQVVKLRNGTALVYLNINNGPRVTTTAFKTTYTKDGLLRYFCNSNCLTITVEYQEKSQLVDNKEDAAGFL